MLRLFVGLRPPPAIRAGLLELVGGVPGARWQDDDQLHITLRFIGEIDRRVAEDCVAALSSVRSPPFELALAGVGRFDTRGRVNALWAGVRPHEAIAALHRKIDAALVRTGLAPERRAYLPHVTLARLNAQAESVEPFLASHAGLVSERFAVEQFLLFESHLGRGGARYEAIARFALSG